MCAEKHRPNEDNFAARSSPKRPRIEKEPMVSCGSDCAESTSCSSDRAAKKGGTEPPRDVEPHLYVFTHNKSGMDAVDRAKIDKIVHEMSKDSAFYKEQKRRDEQTVAKAAELKERAQRLSPAEILSFERQADAELARLEATRGLNKTFIHVDMDAFFAAVEERNDPTLRNIPMAVGGSIISTANYVARKYGVRSAMPGFIAKELCPNLKFVKTNFHAYKEAAAEVQEVLRKFDPEFHSRGLDEATLCVMDRSPSVAHDLKTAIRSATQLPASCGVGPSALVAKVASNFGKPDGVYVVENTRADVARFMSFLPAREVPGIGKVTARLLREALGVETCGDILDKRAYVFALFSEKTREFLLRSALGIDHAGFGHAESSSDRRSVGHERTFRPTSDHGELHAMLNKLADATHRELVEKALVAFTVTLKVKYSNFKVLSKSEAVSGGVGVGDDGGTAMKRALERLMRALDGPSIRLLGVRCSSLEQATEDMIKIEDLFRRAAASTSRSHVANSPVELQSSSRQPSLPAREAQREPPAAAPHQVRCPVCRQFLVTVADASSPDGSRLLNAHIDECLNTQVLVSPHMGRPAKGTTPALRPRSIRDWLHGAAKESAG